MKKEVSSLSNYSVAEADRRQCNERPAVLHDDQKLLKWLKCKKLKESKRFY